MPIEFNLSHEETIAGWDNIANHPDTYKIFEATIENIKTKFNIFYNYGDNLVLFYLNQISDELQKEIHFIIDEQDNNLNKEQINRLKTIMGLCIAGVSTFSEDLFLPIFDSQCAWDAQIAKNRELMISKNKAYGSSWSIMRPEGITDVIHTKVHRIISLLDGAENQYESLKDSFEDIINYCVFCIMRIEMDQKLEGYNQILEVFRENNKKEF